MGDARRLPQPFPSLPKVALISQIHYSGLNPWIQKDPSSLCVCGGGELPI